MTITINAHQLGRLIDRVRSHIGDEGIEVLHGIRLHTDQTHLYAVASDRYTIAVARYRLNHGEQGQAPVGRTLPAAWVKPLRGWLDAQAGSLTVTISVDASRLVFATPHSNVQVPVAASLEFPDWQSILRSVAANIPTIEAFPAVDSRMLARWADTGDTLRVRMTTGSKAFMVFGEDFIGAQMPQRFAGVGPCADETFEQALGLWPGIFADSEDGVDMETVMSSDMVTTGWPRYEASSTVPDMVESLLKQTLRSTSDLLGAPTDEPGAMVSYALAGVEAWSAYRFLNALHRADPRLAAQAVADLAEELDAGDFSEAAWEIAEKAGHDPQAWHDDYEAHLKKVAEKRASAATA